MSKSKSAAVTAATTSPPPPADTLATDLIWGAARKPSKAKAAKPGAEHRAEGNGDNPEDSAAAMKAKHAALEADEAALEQKPKAVDEQAPVGGNPLCDAWERASVEQRAEFARRYADDLRHLFDDHLDDEGGDDDNDLPRLADAVAGAFGELQELADECREVVDNAPEGLNATPRIETLDETASTLEGLDAPDIPAELAEIKITLPKQRKPRSRRDRRDNALGTLTVCIEALDAVEENDPRRKEAADLRDELESASSEAEQCEFPGMYCA